MKCGLTGLEVERHVTANDPTDDDEERSNKESNLDAGANGNTHGQVHLVSGRNHDSSDMLSGVTHNRNQNQTNESLADASSLNQRVNASDEIIGANGDKDRSDDENGSGSNGAHHGFLGLVLLSILVLGIEQVAVGAKLENEVQDVEQEENNGGSAGEGENALHLVFGATLVKNSVELREISLHPRD